MRPNVCALAIAGLDPSGGAGVFADLRAFAAASVWGCAAVTLVTEQSTAGLRASHPIETRRLLGQIRELVSHQRIGGIKIGALGSLANARGVARFLATLGSRVPVVLDPVMRPTLGPGRARLLDTSADRTLRGMLKSVTVVTPNVPEAEALLRTRIRSVEDTERAARALVGLGARAALVKGGHLAAGASRGGVTDVLAVGGRIHRLKAPRVKVSVHGTGCALSSLIAGRLASVGALDDSAIVEAVRWAKQRLTEGLAQSLRIGDGLRVMRL
jgi:hydroxymethylpyrimidine/phosphomethylpyrimidine kinase